MNSLSISRISEAKDLEESKIEEPDWNTLKNIVAKRGVFFEMEKEVESKPVEWLSLTEEILKKENVTECIMDHLKGARDVSHTNKFSELHEIKSRVLDKVVFFLSKYSKMRNYSELMVDNAKLTEKTIREYVQLIKQANNKNVYFLNSVLPLERKISESTKMFKIVNLDIEGGFDWILLKLDFENGLFSYFVPEANRKLDQAKVLELKENLLQEIKVSF